MRYVSIITIIILYNCIETISTSYRVPWLGENHGWESRRRGKLKETDSANRRNESGEEAKEQSSCSYSHAEMHILRCERKVQENWDKAWIIILR